MLKYQMIIFDFDGTLADSKEDVWQSVEYACSFYNCSICQRRNSRDVVKM